MAQTGAPAGFKLHFGRGLLGRTCIISPLADTTACVVESCHQVTAAYTSRKIGCCIEPLQMKSNEGCFCKYSVLELVFCLQRFSAF